MREYVLVEVGESEATPGSVWTGTAARLFPEGSEHASELWIVIFESLREAWAFIEHTGADAGLAEIAEDEGVNLFLGLSDRIKLHGGGIVWVGACAGCDEEGAEGIGQLRADGLRDFIDASDEEDEEDLEMIDEEWWLE